MDVRVLLVVGVRTIKSRILPRIVDDLLRHYEHVVLTVGTTSFHSPSTSPKQNSPSPSSTRCSVACWLPYAAVARPGLQDPYAGPLEVLLRVVHEDLYLRGTAGLFGLLQYVLSFHYSHLQNPYTLPSHA